VIPSWRGARADLRKTRLNALEGHVQQTLSIPETRRRGRVGARAPAVEKVERVDGGCTGPLLLSDRTVDAGRAGQFRNAQARRRLEAHERELVEPRLAGAGRDKRQLEVPGVARRTHGGARGYPVRRPALGNPVRLVLAAVTALRELVEEHRPLAGRTHPAADAVETLAPGRQARTGGAHPLRRIVRMRDTLGNRAVSHGFAIE